MTYEWPGNVRELENVIERELILNTDKAITFQKLVPAHLNKNPLDNVMTKDDIVPLDEVYSQHIEKVLEITNGKINGPGGLPKN